MHEELRGMPTDVRGISEPVGGVMWGLIGHCVPICGWILIGRPFYVVRVLFGGQTVPWAKTKTHAPDPVADEMVIRLRSVVRCEHDDGSC